MSEDSPARPVVENALFDAICAEATLRAAWERVARKGARGGIDEVSVADFGRRLEQRLATLAADLGHGAYVPEPFQQIEIPKADSPGEMRTLKLPTVRDKVAQEAVRSVLAPILERTFADCSYAYRPGKGPVKAIRRVEHLLAAGRRWAATADVDRFFDCMDHDLTLALVRRQVADERVLRLLALWMKMGAISHRGEWRDAEAGIAQGSVISPLLSNVYLTPFDRHLTEHGHGLVRYADDLVVLAPTQAAAERALATARHFLEAELRLALNPAPDAVRSLEQGFVFLGIHFHGAMRCIAESKIAQMRTELAQLCQRPLSIQALVGKLNESLDGWRRYYGVLIPDGAFGSLDAVLIEQLAQRLARAPRSRVATGAIDLAKALSALRFLTARTPAQHRRAVASILGAVKRARLRRSDRRQAGASGLPSARQPPTDVAGAVARRQRRHLRESISATDLVISEPGSFLGKTSRRMVVKKQKRVLAEVPLSQLRHVIVAAPGVSVSGAAIVHCAAQRIPIDFLSPRGDPVARLQAPLDSLGNPGLQQLRAVHDGSGLHLARAFVRGKLRNQLNLVKYYHKYWRRVDGEFASLFVEIEQKFEALQDGLDALLLPTEDYEVGRGRLFAIEGQGAALYWRMIERLLDDDIEFHGRERRGATDLVNAALNYGYGMLYSRIHQALVLAGLNPCVSFLHSFQGSKPTLSYDLIEEFRPHAVDRAVFSLITKGESLAMEDGAGRLTKGTAMKVARAVLGRLAAPVRYRGQRIALQDVIDTQARRLARHLDGQQRYRAFVAQW